MTDLEPIGIMQEVAARAPERGVFHRKVVDFVPYTPGAFPKDKLADNSWRRLHNVFKDIAFSTWMVLGPENTMIF